MTNQTEVGLAIFKWIKKIFIVISILIIVVSILNLFIMNTTNGDIIMSSANPVKFGDAFSSLVESVKSKGQTQNLLPLWINDVKFSISQLFGSKFLSFLNDTLPTINLFILWFIRAFGILLICYVIIIVLRWRTGERKIIYSDWLSTELKRHIIKGLDIKEQVKEIKRSNKGSNTKMGRDQVNKLEALNLIKNVNVICDYRERDEHPGMVSQSITVSISTSKKNSINEQIVSILKSLNPIMDAYFKGRIVSTEPLLTDDRQQIVSNLQTDAEPDPYDFSLEIARLKESSQNVVYDSIYPIDIFPDQSAKIAENTALAEKWGASWKERVNRIVTQKPGLRFSSMEVSGTSCTFVYEVASTGQTLRADEFNEKLNVLLHTQSVSGELSGSTLRISFALPSSFSIPISTRQIFEEIFGKTQVVIPEETN